MPFEEILDGSYDFGYTNIVLIGWAFDAELYLGVELYS